MYQSYTINEAAQFNASEYPDVVSELKAIEAVAAPFPVYFKREIIISFFKNHSIMREWIESNPELSRMVTTGSFPSGHIEALFDSCKKNIPFLAGFEAYIKTKLYQSQG